MAQSFALRLEGNALMVQWSVGAIACCVVMVEGLAIAIKYTLGKLKEKTYS